MNAAGPIFGGYSDAMTYKAQAAQATQQAKDVAIQATETSEQRREQLNSSLANINANRAQSGLSLDSPTAMAIQSAVRATSTRTQQIEKTGSLNKQGSLLHQAATLRASGKNAITGGYIAAYGKVQDTAAKFVGM